MLYDRVHRTLPTIGQATVGDERAMQFPNSRHSIHI